MSMSVSVHAEEGLSVSVDFISGHERRNGLGDLHIIRIGGAGVDVNIFATPEDIRQAGLALLAYAERRLK